MSGYRYCMLCLFLPVLQSDIENDLYLHSPAKRSDQNIMLYWILYYPCCLSCLPVTCVCVCVRARHTCCTCIWRHCRYGHGAYSSLPLTVVLSKFYPGAGVDLDFWLQHVIVVKVPSNAELGSVRLIVSRYAGDPFLSWQLVSGVETATANCETVCLAHMSAVSSVLSRIL